MFDKPIPTTPLTCEGLASSAGRFTGKALNAYVRIDDELAFIFLGIALEHLCKALLLRTNPAFMVEFKPGAFAHILHVSGMRPNPRGLRTVGAQEALERVGQLVTLRDLDDLKAVIEVRNGVLHLATLDDKDRRKRMVAGLSALTSICSALSIGEAEWYGQNFSLVQELRSQRLTDAQTVVTLKIVKANAVYSRRVLSIHPEGAREALIAARDAMVETGAIDEDHFGESMRCPACANWGLLAGEVIVMDDFEMDEDGEIAGHEFGVWTPQEFVCPHCELDLRSADELKTCGLDTNRQLSRDEWEIVYDRDEDVYRDR